MKAKTLLAILFVGIITTSAIYSCKKNQEEPISNSLPAEVTQKLDSIIQTDIQSGNLPGVLVGIWIPGSGEYVKSFGAGNLETGSPRTLTDQFRIASITKTFTGLRILQLHDDSLINIDQKLSEYFPVFPDADKISIRNLLNMNSGIKDFADHEFLHTWYDNPLMPFSMQEAMDLSAQDSSEFYPAGDSVKYCNVNYTILGLIIEQVTGNTVRQEINDHIFAPLGLTSSVYPDFNDLPGNLRGYSWDVALNEFKDKTVLNPVVPNTAGAIISNLYDLKRFVKALYTGELISTATHLEQINTLHMDGNPDWIQYGLGIVNLGGFYGHNGTIFGFSSEMFYLPAKDAVIVINVNRLDVDDQSKSAVLFFKIAKLLFPNDVAW